MKRALIFGVNGFVGSYLTQELQTHGYDVTGSDIQSSDDSGICRGGYLSCDLLDAEAVGRVLKETVPDVVINLAAVSSVGFSWKEPQRTISVNLNGALHILDAVRATAPEAKVLLIGSSEEYVVTEEDISEDTPLNANNPYGISKMALEQFSDIYRKRYGLRIYHVRAFNHTGIGQKETFVIPSWCRQAARIAASGRPGTIYVGNTEVYRDFSHVKDIVRGYRMVLESGDCSVVYNIGSGNAVLLKDILAFITSLSPVPITIAKDPELFRPADNIRICCDHSRITEKLGWKPEYDIFETIEEMFLDDMKKFKEGLISQDAGRS